MAARGTWPALLAAPLLGIAAVHAGGLSQLMLLTGSVDRAVAAGVLPFVLGDLVKAALAALVLRRGRSVTRALR